jgi:hypothetical protein
VTTIVARDYRGNTRIAIRTLFRVAVSNAWRDEERARMTVTEAPREDLTNLISLLRKLPKDHRRKLIIMGYSRIERWIDWQAEKHGVPHVKIDPNGTSSGCSICNYKELEELDYRRLRCPI